MIGVLIVVSDGNNAVGQPEGSTVRVLFMAVSQRPVWHWLSQW
ncbi:MAG: hypothetical protein Ct9H300mP28_18200 [Pseudomonadota bacterium]|nr:MAG: hypothetical protein Ct9H300mP28_18200 [Pseudomonadota bacterium]